MRNNNIFLWFYNTSDYYKVGEIKHCKDVVYSAIFWALMQLNY